MRYIRVFMAPTALWLIVSAAVAGCGSSPVSLSPRGASPTATPTAGAPGATSAPTSTPTPTGVAPTATPTAAPTQTPAGSPIVLNPTTLMFIYDPQEACAAANQPQTFTASESGLVGSFSAKSSNASYFAVTPTSTSTFTVTPSSTDKPSNSNTMITVTDGAGHTASLKITLDQGFCL